MSRKKKPKKLYHLDRGTLPRNIRWLHDLDYLDKLSPEEKEWMNQFIREYYQGTVDSEKVLHEGYIDCRDCRGVGWIIPKKQDFENRITTLKPPYACKLCKNTGKRPMKRDCYDAKNRQNRDILSIMDSSGKMDRIPEDKE